MHDDKAADESNQKKKPDVIQFYNKTKGGVDTMDQMVSTYTCKRRTRRWPMVLWYNMLDIATLNAYTSFTSQHPGYMSGISNARRLFIKELGQELVIPHMKRHLESTPVLQKSKPRNHRATGGHQAGRPREEEEVCNLHNFQGQKSQQLVFPVHQACV